MALSIVIVWALLVTPIALALVWKFVGVDRSGAKGGGRSAADRAERLGDRQQLQHMFAEMRSELAEHQEIWARRDAELKRPGETDISELGDQLRAELWQVRADLAEHQRASAVREAELRQLVGSQSARELIDQLRIDVQEARRVAAIREGELRSMVGASRERLHLVEATVNDMQSEAVTPLRPETTS